MLRGIESHLLEEIDLRLSKFFAKDALWNLSECLYFKKSHAISFSMYSKERKSSHAQHIICLKLLEQQCPTHCQLIASPHLRLSLHVKFCLLVGLQRNKIFDITKRHLSKLPTETCLPLFRFICALAINEWIELLFSPACLSIHNKSRVVATCLEKHYRRRKVIIPVGVGDPFCFHYQPLWCSLLYLEYVIPCKMCRFFL